MTIKPLTETDMWFMEYEDQYHFGTKRGEEAFARLVEQRESMIRAGYDRQRFTKDDISAIDTKRLKELFAELKKRSQQVLYEDHPQEPWLHSEGVLLIDIEELFGALVKK
jgi:hypothetical protein